MKAKQKNRKRNKKNKLHIQVFEYNSCRDKANTEEKNEDDGDEQRSSFLLCVRAKKQKEEKPLIKRND